MGVRHDCEITVRSAVYSMDAKRMRLSISIQPTMMRHRSDNAECKICKISKT